MDRELLIEIGLEELPAAWLPGLTRQFGEHVEARLKDARIAPGAPVESYATPRRLTARLAKIAERQEDLEELVSGPPVSAAFGAGRSADAGRRRLCAQAGRDGGGARSHQVGEGRVPVVPQAPARQERHRRAAGGARRGAARPGVSQADEVGRDARRRAGRVRLRPADSLAAVPLWRPCRSLHHRPRGERRRSAGAGRRVGRADLRPSLPGDERPGRPLDQGPQLRRIRGAPQGALRRPRALRAPRSHRARSRGACPAPQRTGGVEGASAPARRSRGPRGVPGRRGRVLRCGVPRPAGGGALDHARAPPALFPGRLGSRRAQGSLPRRRQHPAEGRAADREERRARRRRAAARCAVLLGKRSQVAARVAARAAAHGGFSQEAWQLSRQDRAHRAAGRVDRRRGAGQAGGGRRGGNGRPARESRSHDRHGLRVPRAAGEDGRHLRPRGRPAGTRLEGDLLPLPPDRRGSGCSAVARSNWGRPR